jgi:nitroimidazol reductase NimA-like FMN-containing flavoprotein (pyridoxamine 5'-phosphate oxidase superfamily)
MNEPVELSYAKCRELLGGGVLGRVALCTPDGPRIFPVNYSLVDESVVLRTSASGSLATHDWRSPLAFEVDHVDYSDHRGWSVVATGPARRVEDADEVAAIKRTWDPRPWAGGTRELYVRLEWTELTGRRLGAGWTDRNELPVRRTVG